MEALRHEQMFDLKRQLALYSRILFLNDPRNRQWGGEWEEVPCWEQCPWGSLRDLDRVRWTWTPLRNIATQRHKPSQDILPFAQLQLA
jgi:hypothetical protein